MDPIFEPKSVFTRSKSCNSTTSTSTINNINFNNNNNNGSSHSHKSKLARTFHKVINLKSSSKFSSNNSIGICVFPYQHKFECYNPNPDHKIPSHGNTKQKAVLEALVAKIFASVTAIKAGYAELQMAQNPYNNGAIQTADEAIVEELRTLSELKRKFLKKELDLSPQITLMLAEIQEQQSLMKTYEITIKKLESDVERKDSEIDSLRKQFKDCLAFNKSLEKKLNASGPLSMFDNINKLSTLNPSQFLQVLHKALRSVKSFVKLMIKEMELANWDLDIAAAKAVEPGVVFVKQNHRCFAFESFVCRTMLEGFNLHDFGLNKEVKPRKTEPGKYFDEFKSLRSANPKLFLARNPNSSFGKFIRTKYLNLVHAKMECSFFGNLNQRKILTGNGFPDSGFFAAFAEMAKRFWLLHCLGFSMNEEVSVFEVKKNCRFSEVYMENVSDESLFSGEINGGDVDIRVSFTVVPGFKIGKTVIQSQVYLSPVITPPVSR
ncbi:CHIQUITA1-LIKE 6, unfertilized embryo sac 1 [Hibiscus trionum]|uniref:CHIQUITA1-LIKE 6, unfertilized embryo sac 1 n=1 Tax=Hibiscus trionum TaxID=183268 RepID=A0A9W7LPR2_HIBTR|nr:CHIQUITA1-LIKE 6, unfertilized embryo sac 1 [Hibiscus trionum]